MSEDRVCERSTTAGHLDRRTLVIGVGLALAAPLVRPGSARADTEQAGPAFDPAGIKAIVFDTVGTLLDTYGSITVT